MRAGFFLESFNGKAFDEAVGSARRVRAGQPFALGARACCAGCTTRSSRRRESWCAWCAARCSTWRWTSASRRRPSDAGWASSSARTTTSSCGCLAGFAHGFLVLSEIGGVSLQDHRLLRARPRARHCWDDRSLAIEWPELGVAFTLSDMIAQRRRWTARSCSPRLQRSVKRLFLDELSLDIGAMPPMPLCGRCQL